MKNEKFKKVSLIVVGVIFGLAFFIEGPLKEVLLRYFYIYPVMLYAFVFGATLLLSLFAITRKYLNLANFLKTFLVTLVFTFADIFVLELSDVTFEFIYQLIRPWIATLLMICLVLWVSKCRIAKDKKLFILIGISYIVKVIVTVFELLATLKNMSDFSHNSFFYYLELMGAYDNKLIFFSVLTLYAFAFFVVLLLIKSIQLYGKEPTGRVEASISDDEPDLIATDGVNWKCMGCGQLVSVEQDRCSCGYKK